MKKACSLFLLLMSGMVVFAQNEKASSEREFKKFKVDVSLGYAIPQGSGIKGGLVFVVEPKYNVMDQLAVGLRMEGALVATVSPINTDNTTIRAISSGIATGDYYFSNKSFRPFLGAGAGFYRQVAADLGTGSITDTGLSTFGFMTRAGFEFGHLRLGAEYNFLKNNSGYFGIKLGACIGGGRIRK